MATRNQYKPMHDPSTSQEMRDRLDALDPESREAIDTEAKRLVDAMHERGARMFGIVSAYELLEKLYMFDKAIELDLKPDLRKKRTLIGLAKSVKPSQ